MTPVAKRELEKLNDAVDAALKRLTVAECIDVLETLASDCGAKWAALLEDTTEEERS